MTGAWRSLSVVLTANTAGFTGAMTRASGVAKGFAVALSVALVASLGQAVKFESAMAGVAKTVDATAAEMRVLEDGIVAMANALPASREEIAGVAEAAGALGVSKGALLEFTEVAIGLGVATSLSAEDAATGLAKIAAVMGTAEGDFDRLGSALVHLGNNGASTEEEILSMAQRLSGAGALIGASEADVLGLANAMSSVGIQAELGGGAFSRVMLKAYEAVKTGDDALDAFAVTAGMTAEQFAVAFGEDPIDALQAVIGGLTGIDAAGGDVIGALDAMGIKGTHNRTVMLNLLGAQETLTKSLDDGRDAWARNTALQDEVTKRYETAESKLRIFGNQVTNVGRIAGAQLVPVLLAAVEAAQGVGSWLYEAGIKLGPHLAGIWSDLSDTGENLGDALGHAADAGSVLAEALGLIGGSAILAGLDGLGSALSATSGYLADNETLVRLIVAGMGAWAAARAWGLIVAGFELIQVAAWRATAAITQSTMLSYLGQAATGAGRLAVALATLPAATNLSAVGAGLATMASGLAGLAAAVAPVALLIGTIYLATSAFQNAKRDAEAFRREVEADVDLRSVDSIREGMRRLGEEANRAQAYFDGGAWQQIDNALHGVYELLPGVEDKMWSNYQAARQAGDGYAYLEEQALLLEARLGQVALRLGMRPDDVEQWANHLNLDVLNDDLDEVADKINVTSGQAAAGRPAVEQLQGAFDVLGSETASATDELDAFREALDAIIGTQVDFEGAQISFAEGILDLKDAALEAFYAGEQWSANLFGGDRASLDTRQRVSDLVDGAMDVATAYYESGAGIEGATQKLMENRLAIIDAGEAAGISRETMSQYLDVLGLTPENIATIIRAETDPASVQNVEEDLDTTGRDRTTTFIPALDEVGLNASDRRLAYLARDRHIRLITSVVGFMDSSGGYASPDAIDRPRDSRWGNVFAFRSGGVTPAHIGRGDLLRYAEPETGGEAFIPRLGDRNRSLGIMRTVADWLNVDIVDRKAVMSRQMATLGAVATQQPSATWHASAPADRPHHLTPGQGSLQVVVQAGLSDGVARELMGRIGGLMSYMATASRPPTRPPTGAEGRILSDLSGYIDRHLGATYTAS